MRYEEVDLLKKAIEAFRFETGLNVIVEDNHLVHHEREIDAVIKIEGYETRYVVEIKNWAQHTNLGVLVNQIKNLPQKGILIADYVNPKMADKLRNMNIPFIDAVGNAYINDKPLYIYIKTNKGKAQRDKNSQGMRETQKRGRAFKPTGLKVLYALLKNQQLIYAPYREIAKVAGVALGTVGWVINDFWREDLSFNAEKYGVKWGGEVAAAKLTGYLKPEKAIIYLLKNDEGYKELFAEK
ncbi:MAG: hypothetical protein ISR69_12260 [Gammaproteobacteria bacterium]|nr:hypothetical protein [Gammaproteobacteria bacterium]